jgi:hypothetical protein
MHYLRPGLLHEGNLSPFESPPDPVGRPLPPPTRAHPRTGNRASGRVSGYAPSSRSPVTPVKGFEEAGATEFDAGPGASETARERDATERP